MGYQKINGQTALAVYPSDNADVPFPASIVSSAATATTANKLVDSAKDFAALNVFAGDIVYNTTDGTAATVVQVDSATTLSLSADIMASAEAYVIYTASSQKTIKANNGCLLYVGDADGDLKCKTASGQDIKFVGLKAGSFLPVQVVKVYATDTTLTNIVAIW